MTDTSNSSLADRIALVLLDYGAMPCERLARVVGARTSVVRDALRADSRFDRVGAGRSSRWRLVLPLDTVADERHNGRGRPRDGLGRNLSGGSRVTDEPTVTDRLAALERRVRALEQRLAHAEAPAA